MAKQSLALRLSLKMQKIADLTKACEKSRDKLRTAVEDAKALLTSWDEDTEEMKEALKIMEGALDTMSQYV